MRIRRFEAPDTKTALAMVKEEMGEDAIILATRTIAPVRDGVAKKGRESWVEVVAAMDYDLEELTGNDAAPATAADVRYGSLRAVSARPEPPALRSNQAGPHERQIRIEAQALRQRFARSGEQKLPADNGMRSKPVQLAASASPPSRPKAEEVAQWRDRLLQQLRVEPPQLRPEGSGPLVLALVGATGVGKTTTAAKLAAWYRLREGCQAALLSMDCYRIGATDQLRTYARIMRLPCELALRKKELQQALVRHQDKEVIIIDTAGKSPFDQQHVQELREWFAVDAAISPHLVVTATTKKEDLTRLIETYAPVDPAGLIITKLDETRAYASLCQQVVASGLPVSCLGIGQRVPEDFMLASRDFLERLFKHGWQAVASELDATASPDAWQGQQYRNIV